MKRGVYAVIESSVFDRSQDNIQTQQANKRRRRHQAAEEEDEPPKFESSLFTPIIKWTEIGENGEPVPVYNLVDVETIKSTCCVIPDIGSANIFRYFVLTPREEWKQLFIKWMKQPHKYDKTAMAEPIDEEVVLSEDEESSEDEDDEDDE